MDKDIFYDLLHSENILFDNRTDAKFEQLFKNLKKVYPDFTPAFEVNFKKPLGPKRKYFHSLIVNETINNFNHLCDTLDIISTPEHLSYLYTTIYTRYTGYLKEIAKFIKENNLLESLYKSPSDKKLADQAYITHFLKANAIYLFWELQHRFSKHSEIDIFSIDDIFEIYFESNPPEELLITNYSGTIVNTIKKPTSVNNKLQAVKGDLENRPESDSILKYNQLIRKDKQDALTRIEEIMNEYNLLDKYYNFRKKRGNKILLAAAIFKMYKSNYFNERIFPGNKPLKTKSITNFFHNRYGNESDTDKEFRNFLGSKGKRFESICFTNSWIDNIT